MTHNLTKDIPNPARDTYFYELGDLVADYFETSGLIETAKIKERILSISYDKVIELQNRIEELEKQIQNQK